MSRRLRRQPVDPVVVTGRSSEKATLARARNQQLPMVWMYFTVGNHKNVDADIPPPNTSAVTQYQLSEVCLRYAASRQRIPEHIRDIACYAYGAHTHACRICGHARFAESALRSQRYSANCRNLTESYESTFRAASDGLAQSDFP
jgi:hypothetical protein